MGTLNRRDFLKFGAVATTTTAAACAYDYKVPAEQVLPYTINPENVQPGLATYYSGLCHGCASACGLIARNKDGRVVHVEGNPDHPNGPGLCAKGHFDLVNAYGPDRLAAPVLGNAPVTWDEANAKLVEAWNSTKAAGKSVAWLGQYRSASVAALLEVLAGAGLKRVHWEPLGVETLLAAARTAYGVDELPSYILDEARTIVSFGHDFLGTAFDSMRTIKGWARAKNPAEGAFVTRLVAITPRVGVSESQADTWLAVNPGTEAIVALALAKLCADARGYAGPAAGLLVGVDVAAAATGSGIPEAKLKMVAEWLAADVSVVLPGGHANAGTDATALAVATLLVNEVLGNVGRTVQFLGSKPGQVNTYADVRALIDDMKAGNVGLLFLDGTDPVFNLPGDLAVVEALAAVGQVVQFGDDGNDSTNEKTLILPTGSALEQWSDANVERGLWVLGQPGMVPMKDCRGLGDQLLTLAKVVAPAPPQWDIGGEPLLAVGGVRWSVVHSASFGEFISGMWRALTGNTDQGWSDVRKKGVLHIPDVRSVTWLLGALPAGGTGVPGDGKTLLVFPSPFLGEGRWANVPWAQELADPITTYFWNSWAEIHPSTAESMGLGIEDVLEIKTGQGAVKVGWFGSKGVHEGVVALISGNGRKTGRYAKGRGVRALDLLGTVIDPIGGALATLTTKATVTRATGESGLHTLVGNIDQAGRHLANNVNVKDAIDNLSGVAASIVPIHHVPIDARVTEAGPVDMYPEPQHPTYRFAMVFDTNTCNGCMACVIACATENNIPFIGPDQMRKGRTMTWIRMDRFWEGQGENQDIRYLPAVCQHCSHAPCEGVCPVLATYHNLDGLNAMIYNRCVGTRYCANNCPYTARRFNYHTWEWPESYHFMLNPDLTTREMGVMEKCTFCVQRVRFAKDQYRDLGQPVPDSAMHKLTACAAACPSESITFGNYKDTDGTVRKLGESPRAYTLLGELNTKPGVRYLGRVSHNQEPMAAAHGGGHGADSEVGGNEHGPAGEHGGGASQHGAADAHAGAATAGDPAHAPAAPANEHPSAPAGGGH